MCQGKILDKPVVLLYDTSGVKGMTLTGEENYGCTADDTAL